MIEGLRSDKPLSRKDAALRLCYLDQWDLLTPQEKDAFGIALWQQIENGNNLPSGTNLLSSVFLRLPAPDPSIATHYFLTVVFKTPAPVFFDESVLTIMIHAATSVNEFQPFLPPREDALAMLDTILIWKPVTPSVFDPDKLKSKRIGRLLGAMLTKVILVSIEPSDLTEHRIESLFGLLPAAPSVIEALPAMVTIHTELEERVIKTVRRALLGRNYEEVCAAANAVDKWADFSKTNKKSVPRGIVEQVVSAIATRREIALAHLVWSARRLFEAEAFIKDDISILTDALADLFEETDYSLSVTSNRWAISLPLLRSECVKLSKLLLDSGVQSAELVKWIEACKTDPLPEVRWALRDPVI